MKGKHMSDYFIPILSYVRYIFSGEIPKISLPIISIWLKFIFLIIFILKE